MPITLHGKEYLVGPALRQKRQARNGDRHISTVFYANQNCPVFRTAVETLEIRVQHLNSQWPTFYPLRTKEELLERWC